MNITDLKRNQVALVTAVTDRNGFEAELREIGFHEGDEVELLAFGPLGRAPVSVRLNRTVIALRRAEAQSIDVDSP